MMLDGLTRLELCTWVERSESAVEWFGLLLRNRNIEVRALERRLVHKPAFVSQQPGEVGQRS
jgi:hypothetical protein